MEVRFEDTGNLVVQGTKNVGLYRLQALLVHRDTDHSNDRAQAEPRSFEVAKDVPKW